MPVIAWKQIALRLAAITLVFALLYALVAALYLSLLPLGAPEDLLRLPQRRGQPALVDKSDSLDYWYDVIAANVIPLTTTVTLSTTATGPVTQTQVVSETALLTRTVTIFETPNGVGLELDLWVRRTSSRGDSLYERIINGSVNATFVQAAFGQVSINGVPLRDTDLNAPTWTLEPVAQAVRVRFSATHASSGYTSGNVWRDSKASRIVPHSDQFVVRWSGARVIGLSPSPSEATANQLIVQRTAPDTLVFASIALELSAVASAQSSTTVQSGSNDLPPAEESRQNFLRRFGDAFDIPLLSSLLYALVNVLPLLIFWRLSARQPNRPRFARALAQAVLALVILRFALAFNTGFNILSYSDWARRLSEWATNVISPYFTTDISNYWLSAISARIALVLIGVLLPAYVWQQTHPPALPQRTLRARLIRLIVWLIPWAIIVGLAAYALGASDWFSISETPMWALMLWSASALAIGVGLALAVLYRRATFQPTPPGVTLLGMWLLIALVALMGLTRNAFEAGPWQPLLWFGVALALGMALLFAFARLTWATAQQAWPRLTLARTARWLLIALGIGLVIPLGALVKAANPLATESNVINLAYDLNNLMQQVWLAGLLWLLFRGGRKGQAIDAFTRAVGILLASVVLYGSGAEWLYIPFSFLIGWQLLLPYFVHDVTFWQQELQPLFARVARDAQSRATLLREILDLNTAADAYKSLRKKLGVKLATGELKFSEYSAKLALAKHAVEKLQAQAVVEGTQTTAKQVALTFGPHDSAWGNAIYGARWSLLFALPWIALYLFNDFFARSVASWQTYPLLEFAIELLRVVSRWVMYGFFFGYFYPYLRGRSGLRKGLGLFAVSVLPFLPSMLLTNASPLEWQASLFWMTQVFIQCMLLGLIAFDYAILAQSGYTWQDVLDVHGLTTVGLSLSSILAAIIAAVTTLAASQTSALVTQAVQFVIKGGTPR